MLGGHYCGVKLYRCKGETHLNMGNAQVSIILSPTSIASESLFGQDPIVRKIVKAMALYVDVRQIKGKRHGSVLLVDANHFIYHRNRDR